MSLCSYSIFKNYHFSTRWDPNPEIKPLQFFKFEAFCENPTSCFLVKAVHADGVGVVYPDDSVSDRNASFEVEPEDEVRGVVNEAPTSGMTRKGEDTDGSFGIEDSLSESEQLADTAGLAVVDFTYQKYVVLTSYAKFEDVHRIRQVAEIKSAIHTFDAETVIFADELPPGFPICYLFLTVEVPVYRAVQSMPMCFCLSYVRVGNRRTLGRNLFDLMVTD